MAERNLAHNSEEIVRLLDAALSDNDAASETSDAPPEESDHDTNSDMSADDSDYVYSSGDSDDNDVDVPPRQPEPQPRVSAHVLLGRRTKKMIKNNVPPFKWSLDPPPTSREENFDLLMTSNKTHQKDGGATFVHATGTRNMVPHAPNASEECVRIIAPKRSSVMTALIDRECCDLSPSATQNKTNHHKVNTRHSARLSPAFYHTTIISPRLYLRNHYGECLTGRKKTINVPTAQH
uniref:(California timema) hypothetical protein n=1 Tax=Timema californicum TaxID=61474 RepID=A0A7R9PBB7_TIMCA|nr:unnamed protein product [Timema californicum]